jgi:transposase
MITQSSWRKGTLLRKFALGAHPIIEHYLQKLRIGELIAAYIPQDQRIKLPIERTLSLLIHNILTTPMPMYALADWLAPLDEQCLGLEPTQRDCIHDDRVGQALERFYRGRHKDVFFHLALRAIKTFGLQCAQIHQDTTTVTFSGQYAAWQVPEHLTHGLNKDHRPDLKQLVLGLSVTADGSVPLVHQVYAGNQTDDRLHPENHQRLRRLLQRADFIYVADCKLATEENLRRLAGFGGRFVSVMPRTRQEDRAFRQQIRDGQVQWVHLLSRKNNRHPDSQVDRYDLAQGQHQAGGYRLLWIRSTQKAEQDAQSRSHRLTKSLDALRELQTRLNTYKLKSRQAIEQALEKVLKDQQTQDWIGYQLQVHRQYQKHFPTRGRPPKDAAKAQLSWKPYFSVSFSVDRQALEQEARTDGVFPLITNLEAVSYPAKRVLEIYKFQGFLEKRHSQLKTWQEVTPVLLKKDERGVAYLHMHVMALMVATLIERQLRRAMKQRSIPALPLYPEARPCRYPTMFDIVRLFQGIERYEVQDGERITLFPANLNRLQEQVLALLQVPSSLYQ